MQTNNHKKILMDEIIPYVEKPSRYLGNELNAVKVGRGISGEGTKDLDEVEIRFALVFPDLYDVGLSNLGLHILGSTLNAIPWVCAERSYAPGVDLEKQLREREIQTFLLESKDPLSSVDAIGMTMQTELTYTNMLNILDLAGLPLRSEDRDETHPLVFAGGPTSFNPEPMAPFFDFFVIGDGEDVIVEIAFLLRANKTLSRDALLLKIGKIQGCYVPRHYTMEVAPDGSLVPALDAPKVIKRVVHDLNTSHFPIDYIVPFTKQVHDRISLEVLRGCTQGCRFCQAGMVTRPVRERTPEKVVELMDESLNRTGYEEVSLVSLSTCDHSKVKKLVATAVERANTDHVSITLPSLRLDSFSVDLSDMVAQERKSGITFAPEAATPRMRAVINKWIPDEELLTMSEATYSRGWDVVKLYFMIGLPTERAEDVDAIASLARRTLAVGKAVNPRARVNLGVSTFVPRPFTPFQWAPQITMDQAHARQQQLAEELGGSRDIKFGKHSPKESFLEGILSRSDRRAGDLVEAAFKNGCRFDGWREHQDMKGWFAAIEETSFDVDWALGAREVGCRLPWDHIDILMDKEWMEEDYKRAVELQHAPDCRAGKCHKCGVIDKERQLCASMLRDHIDARKEAEEVPLPVRQEDTEEAVQRIWFKIGRYSEARLLTHLEAMNAWLRALRRSGARLAYSKGFHPHAKVAFSGATPQGHESVGDYMEIRLVEKTDPQDLLVRLRKRLPPGFEVIDANEVDLKAPSLMSINAGGDYHMQVPQSDWEGLEDRISNVLTATELPVQRRAKKKKKKKYRGRWTSNEPVYKTIDIRPMIHSIDMIEPGTLSTRLVNDGDRGLKARELLSFLVKDPERVRVKRLETLRVEGDTWVPLSE